MYSRNALGMMSRRYVARALFVIAVNPLSVYSAPGLLKPRANYDSSHKAGLGWTDTSVNVSKVSWYYNWSPTPAYPPSAMDGLEFVPMFWGTKSIPDFGGIPGLVSSGSVQYVLGMNEPQTPGQSELTPSQAAQLWIQYMQPLKNNSSSVQLGSPAMTNTDTAMEWMQQFIGNCSSCTIDFLALHYYYINASEMISFITDFNYAFQKPIWVTEWACANFANEADQCDDQQISAFMDTTESFMDQTSWAARYAWFGAFRTMPTGLSSGLQLYDSNGKITPLGEQYIGQSSGAGVRRPRVPIVTILILSIILVGYLGPNWK